MLRKLRTAPVQTSPGGSRITFEGVTKRYGATTVLRGVDIEIAPGELVALLGPSGSGKTTALRCLSGLEEVSSGRILINGEDLTPVPTNRRDMGMVFQSYSLFPHLTVTENVGFGLRMRRIGAADRARRVAAALDTVDLGHLGDRYAHMLSGGQQQRVALARALVTEPRALLLDEPLSALDAKVRVRLREQIRTIQSERGISTLLVTHDQEEALAVADRVAVMRDGVIEQMGTPEELYRQPATAFVADFIGLSNRMPGVVEGGQILVRDTWLPLLADPESEGAVDAQSVGAAGATGAADAANPAGAAEAELSGLAVALVRPEHLTITARAAHEETTVGTATVRTSGFLGALRRTVVEFADGEVAAVQHASGDEFRQGDRVQIGFTVEPVRLS